MTLAGPSSELMGCCDSKPVPGISDIFPNLDEDEKTPDPFTHMTPRQKTIVLNTMTHICKPEAIKGNSAEILLKMFSSHPDFQEAFPMLKGKSRSQMRLSSQMRTIGKRIFMELFKITQNLNNPHELSSLIEVLAVNHHERGISGRHFAAMEDAFMDFLANDYLLEFDDEAREAWCQFWQLLRTVIAEKQMTLPPKLSSHSTIPGPAPKKSFTERFFSRELTSH